jgi:hypothetical protein
MIRRLTLLAGLLLLWLAFTNATCDTNRRQQELTATYELARFQLMGCRDMGADQLDPDTLEKGLDLNEEIEKALAGKKWSKAGSAIAELEECVAQLLGEMKSWDPDGDGLSTYAEFMLYGTSWGNPDSDADGYFDGSEVLRYQTDPLDHCAVPIGAPLDTRIERQCPALMDLKGGY